MIISFDCVQMAGIGGNIASQESLKLNLYTASVQDNDDSTYDDATWNY